MTIIKCISSLLALSLLSPMFAKPNLDKMSQAELTAHYGDKTRAAYAQLDKYVDATRKHLLQAKATPEEIEAFEESQKKWIEYRNAVGRTHNLRSGSITPLICNIRLAAMANDRAFTIWEDYLTTMSPSEPDIMPSPKKM